MHQKRGHFFGPFLSKTVFLKLQPIDILYVAISALREYIPLEQGLRLVAQTICAKAAASESIFH